MTIFNVEFYKYKCCVFIFDKEEWEVHSVYECVLSVDLCATPTSLVVIILPLVGG